MNARTSEDWFEQNAGHIVRGRLRWLSAPLKVLITSTAQSAALQNDNKTGGSNGRNYPDQGGGGGGGEGGGSGWTEGVDILDPMLTPQHGRPVQRPTEATVSLMPGVEEGKKSSMAPFTLVFFAVGMLALGVLVRSRRRLSGSAHSSSAVR